MQRLLTVPATYLKFTFACMLAGAAVFFLAGMAVVEPRTFLLVAVVLIAAFFVVRMEVRSHRRARALNKKEDKPSNVKGLAQYFALAQAATAVLAGAMDKGSLGDAFLWISEWNNIFDPTMLPGNDLIKTSLKEKIDAQTAAVELNLLQQQLAAYGLLMLSVSNMRAEQVLKSMKPVDPLDTKAIRAQIVLSVYGTDEQGRPLSESHEYGTQKPVSVVFLCRRECPLAPEPVEKLLQTYFRTARARHSQEKSTSL